MKDFIIATFICCLSLISCNKKYRSDIQRFKCFVGSISYEATIQMIENMEEKLASTYNTGSFKTDVDLYIRKTMKGDSGLQFTRKDCAVLELYDLMGLESISEKRKYDTVYVDEYDQLVTVANQDTGWTIMQKVQSKEEILEETVDKGFPETIHIGKLFFGLKTLENNDELISLYVDLFEFTPEIIETSIGKYIVEENIDVSKNYFYKLIVFRTYYYEEMKKKGCI